MSSQPLRFNSPTKTLSSSTYSAYSNITASQSIMNSPPSYSSASTGSGGSSIAGAAMLAKPAVGFLAAMGPMGWAIGGVIVAVGVGVIIAEKNR